MPKAQWDGKILASWFAWISPGRGAIASLERIARGYKWKPVAEPLRVVGKPGPEALAQAEELGQTLAAGVEAGIY